MLATIIRGILSASNYTSVDITTYQGKGGAIDHRPCSYALRLTPYSSFLALSLLCLPAVVAAQDNAAEVEARAEIRASGDEPEADVAPASDTAQLGAVTVTAQQREESAQDVPISISVFSQQEARDLNAYDINDLGQFTPGLETNNLSVTQPRYTIRGITTNDFGIGSDPAVGVYVDGVYVGRSGAGQLNFNDVERIEVLKGPQGTLFGRNAAAGAIQRSDAAART